MEFVQTLDDYGKPAWITLMIVGFIVFWPIGLGILFYLMWSGRMGCKSRNWKGLSEGRWNRAHKAFRSTGNNAFDEYRDETLSRLQREADEFKTFMERLRAARDKAEFDQFIAERDGTSGGNSDRASGAEPQAS
jgi:hypothetical protein